VPPSRHTPLMRRRGFAAVGIRLAAAAMMARSAYALQVGGTRLKCLSKCQIDHS